MNTVGPANTDSPANTENPALPAATVIVARNGAGGLEVLLLRRSDVGAFAGMWVFPGGRVDEADVSRATAGSGGAASDTAAHELAVARHAAVREAAEEVGITLDLATLAPFSHWTPPEGNGHRRRFATWFFVAPWAGDTVTVDGHEIVDHRWAAPAAAIATGLPVAPPTYVTLHQLAGFATWDALRTGLDTWPVERFFTRGGRQADGASVLMWTGDAGYDDGDADRPGARHRVLVDGMRPLAYLRNG